MKSAPVAPADLAQPTPSELALSGAWTALGASGVARKRIENLRVPSGQVVVDGEAVEALDPVGAHVVQTLLERLKADGHEVQLRAWPEQYARLLETAGQHRVVPAPDTPEPHGLL